MADADSPAEPVMPGTREGGGWDTREAVVGWVARILHHHWHPRDLAASPRELAEQLYGIALDFDLLPLDVLVAWVICQHTESRLVTFQAFARFAAAFQSAMALATVEGEAEAS
jgi:hypothetical protein